MSSRIIRGGKSNKTSRINTLGGDSLPGLPQSHIMGVEKQAFERGYQEGNEIGKQMGEQMMETAVKRYDQTIVDMAVSHKKLVESMERETVRLSLAIAKSILGRAVSTDPDVVTVLVSLALKRLQGHHEIVLKVSPDDFERVRSGIENIDSAVRVEQVSSLERGDFILDSSKTHFDGRMMSRLDHIGRELLDEA